MDQTNSAATDLQLISPAFKAGAAIPLQYTCKGQNVNPPLNILGVPAKAQSLALIVHDPDAVGSDFSHWVLWDIPTATETIAANSVPAGARQGLNDGGKAGYMGPCPPAGSGTHRYMFELYALDTNPNLPENGRRVDLEKAMQGNIVAQHTLTGLFSAD